MRPILAKAFTLFELVVVIVVAAVIGMLLVFGTRDFFVRARVMKVGEEQALLARALENYRVDYKAYPPPADQLDALLAPAAYVATLPSDPFSRDAALDSYRYFRQPGGGFAWAIVSPGPDGEIDFAPAPPELFQQGPDALANGGSPTGWPSLAGLSALRAGGGSGANGATALRRGTGQAAASEDGLGHGGASGMPAWKSALLVPQAPQPGGGQGGDGPFAPQPWIYADREAFKHYARLVSYDPTNGTFSAGDIIELSDY